MAKAQHYQKIERVRVKDQLVEPFVPAYQAALERLKAHFATGREQD
jgi:ATP-dependent RNA helicase DDX51/DBP6